MIHGVYTAVLGATLLAAAPSAIYRRVSRGVPLRLRLRLGYAPPRQGGVRCGWIHAVSVGESIAAAPIVEGLGRLAPELPLVMTTVTETGARVVTERYRGVDHRFFPLDLPGAVRRAVDRINPAFLVCMETELWPNVFRALARRRVPVMIANGRISDRSYPRYRAVRALLGSVLADIQVFAMQSAEDARRIVALGAPADRVFVTGNLKYEAQADAGESGEDWRRRLGVAATTSLWIAGSTHAGEEAMVLDAHARLREGAPGVRLLIAPRHPERASEVADLVRSRGLPVVRRSELPRDAPADAVIVVDTVGELASIYSTAEVVFVGGSLVAHGGHNVLEPAMRGKPVVFGPHTENFRESAALLADSGGGLVVRDRDELGRVLTRLLRDPAERTALGVAARGAAMSRTGAVRETLALIGRFLLHPG